jgi:hypothetical protein
MVGKRVQFDDETWEAIQAVMRDGGNSFQELADEAFADLLKKRKQPVGLKAALKENVKKAVIKKGEARFGGRPFLTVTRQPSATSLLRPFARALGFPKSHSRQLFFVPLCPKRHSLLGARTL